MQTIETTVHGVSVSNRVPARLEIDKSCEGKTIYVDQSDYLQELSNIKEGFKYCIDTVIDLNGLEIEIPSYGIVLHGMSSNAGLIDSTNGHTMFKSPEGGSGNIMISNLQLTQSGDDSCLFHIWNNDQFDDITFERNVMNINSVGAIYGFDKINYNKCLPLHTDLRNIAIDSDTTYYRYTH